MIVLLAVRPAVSRTVYGITYVPSGAVVVMATSRPVGVTVHASGSSGGTLAPSVSVNGSPFWSNAGTRFTFGTPTSAATVIALAIGTVFGFVAATTSVIVPPVCWPYGSFTV